MSLALTQARNFAFSIPLSTCIYLGLLISLHFTSVYFKIVSIFTFPSLFHCLFQLPLLPHTYTTKTPVPSYKIQTTFPPSFSNGSENPLATSEQLFSHLVCVSHAYPTASIIIWSPPRGVFSQICLFRHHPTSPQPRTPLTTCLWWLYSTLSLPNHFPIAFAQFWHLRSHFRPIFSFFGRFNCRFLRSCTRYRPDDVPRPIDIDSGQFRTRRLRFQSPDSRYRVFLFPPPLFRFSDSRTQPGPSLRSYKLSLTY